MSLSGSPSERMLARRPSSPLYSTHSRYQATIRLEIATMRQVRAELVAAGLADDAEIDAHVAAVGAGELDLTLAPLISAWGRRPG